MSLRVAIVAPTLEILGGHSVQAAALLDGWQGDAGDVDAWLVPINPAPPAWLAGAARVRYVRTLVTQIAYWPLLWRELRRADVVHVFSASYTSFLLSPLPAWLVARAFGKPVLLNYHSGEADDHLRRSRLARAVLRRVGPTIVPSRFLVDVFARFRLAAEAIPNIIDRERFRFRPRERLRPRLLSTRNFEANYNVACTLRAFARVQARHPDATLTVIGSGSQAASLQEQAASLGLRGVTFTGRVAPADMARYLDEADIYLQTPAVDNMPLSVLEAFSSGLPVISTDAGGVRTMLTHDVHGLLAPLDDDAAVADNICRLLEEPGLGARLAAAARRETDACVWDAVRDRWAAAYARLVRPSLAAVAAPEHP
ncbi:MAG: glycosyltransferase family 4 protein [Vicinamibacteraceae bacterium]